MVLVNVWFVDRKYRAKACGLGAEGNEASVDWQKVQRQGESFFRTWVTPCMPAYPLTLTTDAYFTNRIVCVCSGNTEVFYFLFNRHTC
jgi:hypothetical protein